MKKILLISLLAYSPIFALVSAPKTAPKTTVSVKKAVTPKATLQAAQAKLKAAQAKLAQEQADLDKATVAKVQAAAHLDKTKRSVDMGILSSIDVVNQTFSPLTLYGISNNTSQVLAQLPGGRKTPAQTVKTKGVEFIYVESTSASTPISIANGIQAITISQKSDFGAFTYTLKPLIPEYGNHVLIYNGSTTSQTARLTLNNSSLWKSVKAFFSASSSNAQQINLIYTIAPNTTYVCAIPPFAEPETLTPITLATATFGIKNGTTWKLSQPPINITTANHNTFVIVPSSIPGDYPTLVQSK